MSTQAGEQKAPEVIVKKAPKRQPKAATQADGSPTTPESEKRLSVVSKELEAIRRKLVEADKLKARRLELIKEAHALGLSTSDLSSNTGVSVARLRQLLHK
jgi:hypothetical protein